MKYRRIIFRTKIVCIMIKLHSYLSKCRTLSSFFFMRPSRLFLPFHITHLKQRFSIILHLGYINFFFQKKLQRTLVLRILELGSLFYVDLDMCVFHAHLYSYRYWMILNVLFIILFPNSFFWIRGKLKLLAKSGIFTPIFQELVFDFAFVFMFVFLFSLTSSTCYSFA